MPMPRSSAIREEKVSAFCAHGLLPSEKEGGLWTKRGEEPINGRN